VNILFLIPASVGKLPSQRFRFEQFLSDLETNRLNYTIKPFYNNSTWDVLYKDGYYAKKTIGTLLGFAKRFLNLFNMGQYQYVYIHREAAPLGPPIIEWIISKILKKKIIYDFDDAIWIPMSTSVNHVAKSLKCTWKVGRICRYSYAIIAGNSYLADYAKKFNSNVLVIPSVVDTDKTHNIIKQHFPGPVTIGWTGTFTNLIHFKEIITPLERLQSKYSFRLLIICDKDPALKGIRYEYKKWDKNSEIKDLLEFDIGLMPLLHFEFILGKCAFKAIQYMSLGIPPVISPVGMNCEVIEDNVSGFFANTEEEWYLTLEKLINNHERRKKTGLSARQRIIDKYSVKAYRDIFLGLFKKLSTQYRNQSN
jgi:glycosyltransferase involved in cell wall biosynthesis